MFLLLPPSKAYFDFFSCLTIKLQTSSVYICIFLFLVNLCIFFNRFDYMLVYRFFQFRTSETESRFKFNVTKAMYIVYLHDSCRHYFQSNYQFLMSSSHAWSLTKRPLKSHLHLWLQQTVLLSMTFSRIFTDKRNLIYFLYRLFCI